MLKFIKPVIYLEGFSRSELDENIETLKKLGYKCSMNIKKANLILFKNKCNIDTDKPKKSISIFFNEHVAS